MRAMLASTQSGAAAHEGSRGGATSLAAT